MNNGKEIRKKNSAINGIMCTVQCNKQNNNCKQNGKMV